MLPRLPRQDTRPDTHLDIDLLRVILTKFNFVLSRSFW
jgi:hypothetical protein